MKRLTEFVTELFVLAVVVMTLLAFARPAWATPFFEHASLAPSSMQGEFFTGPMRTNKSWGQVTLLPVFYRNAAATAPWYEPSCAPLVIGGSYGGGSASANLGSVLDLGPQLISAIEVGVGLFSQPAKASVVSFFACSASATACGAISAGVLLNINVQDGGKFSTSWKDLWLHPLGYFLGPRIRFGGVKSEGAQ